MRKIKNGKVYDTDTARQVGSYENMHDASDFDWYEEALYRKRTGEYFLHGRGGAMTRYAVATGANNWRGGEAIMPLAYDDAREWAETCLSVDEYEAEFGEAPEGDGTVTVCLRVTEETARLLEQASAKTGDGKGAIATEAITKICREKMK